MITNKLSLGGRSPTFPSGRALYTSVDKSTLTSYVLTNGVVSFTFLEDVDSGVRLYSWQENTFAAPVINQSKNLWSIGMLADYKLNSPTDTYYDTYVVYPKNGDFTTPASALPTVTDNGKSFTFTWNNVSYDRKKPSYTCTVTVTATLPEGENSLDLQTSVKANQSYIKRDLVAGASSIVYYLGLPSIVIKKDSVEGTNNNSFLTSPVAFGYTYLNPFKYLRSPRFPGESFQYNGDGERCYAAGHPSNPTAALFKWNYGSPGGFSIPAMVYGNRDTKEGTLIYGLDSEGTNPKSFQFYSDDENIYIKTAHTSDHAYDPYGVGGYTNGSTIGQDYSVDNTPTWSLRIHPFKSTTKWTDWYGYELYKSTVVSKQESYGWLPSSFYNRYIAGEISKEAAEIPMIVNAAGYTTGTKDNLSNSVSFYKDLYIQAVNPNYNGNPIVAMHYQTAELNYDPNRNTGASSPSATYNGWEPWAGFGTGVDYTGPEAYKAPDLTGLNSNTTGAFATLTQDGVLPYSYNIFPFTISSGSIWTQTYSGMDLVGKSLYDEERSITYEAYKTWAYSGSAPGLFAYGFSTCFVPQVSKNKNKEIAFTLGSQGMNAYHDTLGSWGRGCLAKSHTHYDPVDRVNVVTTHPRSTFSRYSIRKQLDWVNEWSEASASGFNSVWSGVGSSVSSNEWKMAQASEFPTDLQLKAVPIALLYEPLGPIFNAYLNDVSNPRSDALANSALLGVPIDNQSDATLSSLVNAGADYWGCIVNPPNWIQRCPVYQIALSDRSISNEWQGIYASNASNFFYKAAEPTGVGLYGQKFYDTGASEENQVQDWAAFSLTQWPYSNRMSVWHYDNQQSFYSAGLSGIENDENIALNSGVWSGYTNNLTTRMLRVQAYNPDFMYHGIILHPLDDYTVERSTAAYATNKAFKSQHPNLLSITGNAPGDEKITHFVRKHRSNGNLLIVAANWFSGDATFEATFDPASYGITNSYQVYSLDVNTVNHGTKTLDTIVEASESFNVSLNLSQYEFKVYEIEINQGLLDNEVFADLKTDYSPVAYSYSLQSITKDSLSLAYSYGTTAFGDINDPMAGFKAPATQEVLNNLPQWMKMRQSHDSNGWKLTNSWGMALERIVEDVESNTYNLNIVTAQTYPLSKVNYIDVDSKSLVEPKVSRNLLFNSAFSIKDVSRSKMPAGWEKYDLLQNTYLNNRNSIVTCSSLTSTQGNLKIGQELILGNLMVSKLYASVYILCDAPNTDITLHVSVEHIDATNNASQAKVTNRSTEWVRLVLPIDVNKQVYRVNFSVSCNCDAEVSITAPQLELNALTPWSKSILDISPVQPFTPAFNLVYAASSDFNSKKIPVYPITDELSFIEASLPTRIEKAPNPYKDIEPYSTAAFGRKVDQLNEVTRTEFTVINNQVVERAISPTPWDIFGRYNIKDLRFYEELKYGTRDEFNVTLEPLVAAVRKDYLYVVCKETFNGESNYVLKMINPRTPPDNEDYLESLIDFNLNLTLNKVLSIGSQVEESLFSISFSDIEPNYMIITTTNNIRHYYKLHFDYYYFNSSKNRLYLIESYPEATITVI